MKWLFFVSAPPWESLDWLQEPFIFIIIEGQDAADEDASMGFKNKNVHLVNGKSSI